MEPVKKEILTRIAMGKATSKILHDLLWSGENIIKNKKKTTLFYMGQKWLLIKTIKEKIRTVKLRLRV